MKYILAISGGVDSVVLLDKISCHPDTETSSAVNTSVSGSMKNLQTTFPDKLVSSKRTEPCDIPIPTQRVGGDPVTRSAPLANKSSKQYQEKCLADFSKAKLDNIIIAHFDHGIRQESKLDADFVRGLAKKYNLPFVLGKAKLGKNASEKTARKARYDFLRSIDTGKEAKKIITAHHQDDLIETIVMNILRGTGWRGLTPFWSDDIIRPLINMTKAEIVRYAIEHNLEWIEDETNYNSKYFRNRIRFSLNYASQKQKNKLVKLYNKQKAIRTEVEKTLEDIPILTSSANGSDPLVIRVDIIKNLDDNIAIEVLNKIIDGRLTNPQLKRLQNFLHSSKSGDICQPGGGLQVGIYHDNITISPL